MGTERMTGELVETGRTPEAAARTRAPAGGLAHTVLALQRSHGNGAVTQALVHSGRPAARRLQRSEAPIHEATERHGLTTAGLTNEEASGAYLGNWMRDLNQALVPLVTDIAPANVVFAMLSYMAALKFGRTMSGEQFGYYIPSEHIDSPAGLTQGDVLPANPVTTAPPAGAKARAAPYVTPQEPVEAGTPGARGLFTVDETGTATWIRRTNAHVERRLELAVRSGRNPEGFMHLGAALHAVEDLFAHSNWIEIALNDLLKDASFLPEQKDRNVFAYAVEQTVGTSASGPVRRIPLMTGSFTGADTQISLSSELMKFLAAPLPEPKGQAQIEAEDRFMASMLAAYEKQIPVQPPLGLTWSQVYLGTRAHMPEFVRKRIDAIRQPVRVAVSTYVLQPLAKRMQAEALNARVQDTSLLVFEREQQRIQSREVKDLTPAERAIMEGKQRLGAGTIDEQVAKEKEAAKQHAAALAQTPARVKAGPTHSQLGKDHANSPFFGLNVRLGAEAVRRLGERIVAAWAEAGDKGPYDWAGFLAANDPHRRLYHDTRTERNAQGDESLAQGQRIVQQGGDVHAKKGKPASFTPYDIAEMRADSAAQVREVGAGLKAAAGAPDQAAGTLDALQRRLSGIGLKDERIKKAEQALVDARAGTLRAGQAVDEAAELRTLAARVEGYAADIERAQSHAERERVNLALVKVRNDALVALARRPSAATGLAASVLALLDKQIAETAPAYTGAQLAALNAGPALAVKPHTFADPAVASDPAWNGGRRGPALTELIRESRLLMNHPLADRWWVPVFTAYLADPRRRKQVLADIEARNAGYAVLWHRGESGGGHGH